MYDRCIALHCIVTLGQPLAVPVSGGEQPDLSEARSSTAVAASASKGGGDDGGCGKLAKHCLSSSSRLASQLPDFHEASRITALNASTGVCSHSSCPFAKGESARMLHSACMPPQQAIISPAYVHLQTVESVMLTGFFRSRGTSCTTRDRSGSFSRSGDLGQNRE